MKISPSSYPKKIEGQDSKTRDLGDEILAYDRVRGKVHVLNGTARRIYTLCDGSQTVGEIADQLTRQYDVDADTALSDLIATIERLVQLGLVEILP